MYLCNINNCYQGADVSDSVQGVMILVRLSTEQRMNAERQLTVCSLPFRPLCLFVYAFRRHYRTENYVRKLSKTFGK